VVVALKTISHAWKALSILMLTGGGYIDMADRCLEFDQGVGLVMSVSGASLAASTEISVMADSTLIAVANNVLGGL
jgi:hypothetical protein